MPRILSQLTNPEFAKAVRDLQPLKAGGQPLTGDAARPLKKKVAVGGGLTLERNAHGALKWRLRYTFGGKQRELALGAYPALGYGAALDKRNDALESLAAGVDPAEERRAVKEATLAALDAAPIILPTFRLYADALLAELADGQAPQTVAKWNLHLGYATAEFGERLIESITAPEVRAFLVDGWQKTGKLHTMHSIKRKVAAVFGRAAYEGAISGNPLDAYALKAMRLREARDEHHPAITDSPERLGDVLRAIDRHRGDPSVRGALQFLALTFQRPHMVRFMRWEQVNFAAKQWEISAADMKGEAGKARDHIVPLCPQALAILEAMKPIATGNLVFPGRISRERPGDEKPMSDASLNMALRRMEIRDHVAHGFRATANSMLKAKLGYRREQELIDRCLAHVVGSKVQQAYDRAEMLDERRALMAKWGNYLDTLRGRAGSVRQLRKAA